MSHQNRCRQHWDLAVPQKNATLLLHMYDDTILNPVILTIPGIILPQLFVVYISWLLHFIFFPTFICHYRLMDFSKCSARYFFFWCGSLFEVVLGCTFVFRTMCLPKQVCVCACARVHVWFLKPLVPALDSNVNKILLKVLW